MTTPADPPRPTRVQQTENRDANVAKLDALGLTGDILGERVREAWVRWAETQPNPKPHWLVPWGELGEADREADRQIGRSIALWTLLHTGAALTTEPSDSPELDATDGAHPAWWRGCDHGVEATCERITEVLDGTLQPPHAFGSAKLTALAERLSALTAEPEASARDAELGAALRAALPDLDYMDKLVIKLLPSGELEPALWKNHGRILDTDATRALADSLAARATTHEDER